MSIDNANNFLHSTCQVLDVNYEKLHLGRKFLAATVYSYIHFASVLIRSLIGLAKLLPCVQFLYEI